MDYRIESDTMGQMRVPADALWGAQTQRSLENFPIGTQTMPREILDAFAVLKKGAAIANFRLGRLGREQRDAIAQAADEMLDGKLEGNFPLVVWQTGSGTQSNMNVNEVLARRANQILGQDLCHPNDTVNMSQSSNDTFPTAMHIAAVSALHTKVLPAINVLAQTLKEIEDENADVIKCGRTHLQDAVPISFAQEVSGWRTMLESSAAQVRSSMAGLYELALGGTAVGTGLNAPDGFDRAVAQEISVITGEPFVTAPNKFHALTSKDALCFSHGALKALAANLMKIANDVRWLASGPRLGLGEIEIPANEPGSSIMPGKVNPTQCEALTMVAVQVMGNDATIGFAASQGNFELNVFMPVIAYNYLQSAELLSDAMCSFAKRCASGIKPRRDVMEHNLHNSLMLVTCLSPHIGYERAAEVAHKAHDEGCTLREACLALGYMDAAAFDAAFKPEEMI